MIRSCLAAVLALAALACAHAETVQWHGGRWFDGERFVEGTRYTRGGIFVEAPARPAERRVELDGRFVVPAYGDAHHHGIDSDDALDDKITVFLEAGIYYVKNPNVIPQLLTPAVRERLNRPGSIGVVFANGGLTAPGGHPVPLHAYLASIGVFRGLKPEDMEGRAYYTMADEAELEAKWPAVLAGRPDFIKTFLLFSEEYRKRRDDPKAYKGLDPLLLGSIVARAHAAGLRVSTHIDTAADFRNAVDAGVDEINHTPQPDQRFSPSLSAYYIDEATARRAAARGIVVVTTASTEERLSGSAFLPEWIEPMRAVQRANFRVLERAGVKLAIGSDGISGERRFVTARDEVRFLARERMLSPLELLRAWSVETPRTIFPQRRLGALAPGYEADFLVLGADPLDDPENLHRISMRVQGGEMLPPMPVFKLGR